MIIQQIVRTAAPKNHIAKYKIEDPHLRFFIYTYESLIPWKDMESKEDIDKYISNVLLPELSKKIQPRSENNHYVKNIDVDKVAELNYNDKIVQDIYEDYLIEPEKGLKKMLAYFNESKELSFRSWWDYMAKSYTNSPAFAYSILRSIIDSSNAKIRNPVISDNPAVISKMFDAINETGGHQAINLQKKYKKEITKEHSKEHVKEEGDTSAYWVNIKSQINDPKKYQENIKKLQDFSTQAVWSTSGDAKSRDHLSKGDFWIYIENGVPRVAIAMEGDHIAEIQGPRNETPYQHWETVLNFISENNLPQEGDNYGKLVIAKEVNEKFEVDAEYREEFISNIDEESYYQLSDKNKDLLPEESKERIENVFAERLKLRKFVRGGDLSVIAVWNQIPNEVKTKRFKAKVTDKIVDFVSEDPIENYPIAKTDFGHLPGVHEAGFKGFVKGLLKNPRMEIPEEFQDQAKMIEAQEQGWFELVQAFPFEIDNAPEKLQNDKRFITVALQSWELSRSKFPSQYNEPPEVIQDAPNYREIRSTIWNDIIKENPYYLENAPEHLRQTLKPMALEGWQAKSEREAFPMLYGRIPETMRDQLHLSDEMRNKVIEYYKELRMQSPGTVTPKELGQDRQSEVAQGLERLEEDPGNYTRLQKDVQNDEQLIRGFRELFAWKFKTNPGEYIYEGKWHKALINYTDIDFQTHIQNIPEIQAALQALINEWLEAIAANPRIDIRLAPAMIQEQLSAVRAQASADVSINWFKYAKINSELQRYK